MHGEPPGSTKYQTRNHCVSNGTLRPNPARLKMGFQHRRTTRLGRTWRPQDSPRVGYPELKANREEYLRLSTKQRLQPSRCYKHFTTPPNSHGFRGLYHLHVHRINLILSNRNLIAVTPFASFPINCTTLQQVKLDFLRN